MTSDFKKYLKKIWLCISPTYRQVCGIEEHLYRMEKYPLQMLTMLTHMMELNQAAACNHPQVFSEYKNAFNGKNVVLIATGSSANYFIPLKNAVYVGVNRAYKLDNIKLDYLFISDWHGYTDIEDIANLPYPVKKFYGIIPPYIFSKDNRSILIPESVALRHNASRFYIKDQSDQLVPKEELRMTYDISSMPLTCICSIVHPAMQFILYGNSKRIYLVGCDTNNEPHFYGDDSHDLNVEKTLEGWIKIKRFANDYYPETEIISINPVGLRGMFRDVYTKGFLDDHPEVSNNDVEILDGKSL